MKLLEYSKSFVPVIVMAILAVLAGLGVTADMRVEDAVALLVTAGLVWLVPNRKKK